MQRLEVGGAVRPIYGSLGFKRLIPNPVTVRDSEPVQFTTHHYSLSPYNIHYRRPVQPGARGQHVARHAVLCCPPRCKEITYFKPLSGKAEIERPQKI